MGFQPEGLNFSLRLGRLQEARVLRLIPNSNVVLGVWMRLQKESGGGQGRRIRGGGGGRRRRRSRRRRRRRRITLG